MIAVLITTLIIGGMIPAFNGKGAGYKGAVVKVRTNSTKAKELVVRYDTWIEYEAYEDKDPVYEFDLMEYCLIIEKRKDCAHIVQN